jgi:hypothetical protein
LIHADLNDNAGAEGGGRRKEEGFRMRRGWYRMKGKVYRMMEGCVCTE